MTRWQVMITDKQGRYRQIHRKSGGGITASWRRAKATRRGWVRSSGNLTAKERRRAVRLAKRRGWKYTVYSDKKYPYVTLKTGERWPRGRKGRSLLFRMNELGRYLQRRIHIISGYRGWTEQNQLWLDFKAGLGAPANHPSIIDDHRRGEAADCGVIAADGAYWNIGEHPRLRDKNQTLLKKFGLFLPYRPPFSWAHANGNNEIWHAEAIAGRRRLLTNRRKK